MVEGFESRAVNGRSAEGLETERQDVHLEFLRTTPLKLKRDGISVVCEEALIEYLVLEFEVPPRTYQKKLAGLIIRSFDYYTCNEFAIEAKKNTNLREQVSFSYLYQDIPKRIAKLIAAGKFPFKLDNELDIILPALIKSGLLDADAIAEKILNHSLQNEAKRKRRK